MNVESIEIQFPLFEWHQFTTSHVGTIQQTTSIQFCPDHPDSNSSPADSFLLENTPFISKHYLSKETVATSNHSFVTISHPDQLE